MRDSTDPAAIPLPGLELVAGYIDGTYAWAADAWLRFLPPIRRVRITVTGDPKAGVIDVENGDCTPAQAAEFIKTRQAAGVGATVYCDRDTLPAVHTACAGLSYHLWVATLDGTKTVPGSGIVAVQYAGSKITGGDYDESLVYDPHWHPSPAPPPAWLVRARTMAHDLSALLDGSTA